MIDGKVTVLSGAPKVVARWKTLLPELHRAYYGFAPGENRDPDVVRGLLPEGIRGAFDALDKRSAFRLVAAIEGQAVPPQ